MIVILMPVHAHPLLQNPSYIKMPKKSNPKCALSISMQIYFYLLAFAKQKEDRRTFTHANDVVTKGKIRWSLNVSFKFLTLLQRQQRLEWKSSIYLLSAVYITSSWYKKLKPKIKKSMHRFRRALLFINKMAQPQHIITGHRLLITWLFWLSALVIKPEFMKTLNTDNKWRICLLQRHRRLQNWLKSDCSNLQLPCSIRWGNFLILIL